MAYVVKIAGKHSTKYRIMHRSKIDNKLYQIQVFNEEKEARKQCNYINNRLDDDYDLSFLTSLIEKTLSGDNLDVIVNEIFYKYVIGKHSSTSSHLNRVLMALCHVLGRSKYYNEKAGKETLPACTLRELCQHYDRVFEIFDKEKKHRNTQMIRHNHVKESIDIYFNYRFRPDEIFNYEIKSKREQNTFFNEVYIDKEIFEKIYSCATPMLKRGMLIVAYTGLRFGTTELIGMKYEHFNFDFEYPEVRITNAKRKNNSNKPLPRYRYVPLCDKLINLVKSWHEEDVQLGLDPLYVIRNNDGSKMSGLGTQFDRAQEKAGLKGVQIRPYNMRHVFCQELLDNGVDRLAVAHMLGHTSTEMIDRVYGTDTTIRRRAAIPILNHLNLKV